MGRLISSADIVTAKGALNIKEKARRILDIAASVTALPAVMSSGAPTVTAGTAGANSTVITGADQYTPTVLPNDARLLTVSAPNMIGSSGFYAPVYITETSAPRSKGWGVAFETDAQAFDVAVRDFNNGIRIKVNGQWTQAADYTLFSGGTGSNIKYVKVDFGSSANRVVEIYFDAIFTIRGFNFGPSAGAASVSAQPYKVWQPGRLASLPKIFMPGTSYEYGVGPSYIRDSLTFVLGELLGIPTVCSMGVGGQGYVGLSNNGGIDITGHLSDFLPANIGTPDMILLGGLGINDQGKTPATVQTNATTTIQYIRDNQPNAIIGVVTAWRAPGKAPAQNINDAIVAGYNAVADTSRMFLIDTFSKGYQDTSGGNSSLYIQADTVHPNTAGDVYLGTRLRADVSDALRIIAA